MELVELTIDPPELALMLMLLDELNVEPLWLPCPSWSGFVPALAEDSGPVASGAVIAESLGGKS